MTLKEFHDGIEKMRSVYPFKDESTTLISIYDLKTYGNNLITIATVDERTGVKLDMSVYTKENKPQEETDSIQTVLDCIK